MHAGLAPLVHVPLRSVFASRSVDTETCARQPRGREQFTHVHPNHVSSDFVFRDSRPNFTYLPAAGAGA